MSRSRVFTNHDFYRCHEVIEEVSASFFCYGDHVRHRRLYLEDDEMKQVECWCGQREVLLILRVDLPEDLVGVASTVKILEDVICIIVRVEAHL